MTREIISRRARRRQVALAAQCRTQSGMRDKGMISDISAQGCCVITQGLFIKVGARVVVRPEGLEGLTGVVRWVEGTRAGIEFDTPLYGPIVDHLAERFPHGQRMTIAPY